MESIINSLIFKRIFLTIIPLGLTLYLMWDIYINHLTKSKEKVKYSWVLIGLFFYVCAYIMVFTPLGSYRYLFRFLGMNYFIVFFSQTIFSSMTYKTAKYEKILITLDTFTEMLLPLAFFFSELHIDSASYLNPLKASELWSINFILIFVCFLFLLTTTLINLFLRIKATYFRYTTTFFLLNSFFLLLSTLIPISNYLTILFWYLFIISFKQEKTYAFTS